jgi:photosystem II stability/assembly factor-like uncharacterized protein
MTNPGRINRATVTAAFLSVFLTACGGGGGGSGDRIFIPSAPVNVQAVAADQQNTVSWDRVDGATEYTVYWNDVGGVTDSDNVITSVNISQTTHTGLVNGQIYYYRVEALAGSQSSGLSDSTGLGTPLASSTTDGLLDMAWNRAKRLVAVAESGNVIAGMIVENLDGTGTTVLWEPPLQPTTEVLGGVAWNGRIFLAVGGGGTVLSSTDGVNWSSPVTGTAPDADLNAVTRWIDNRFVAVGASGRIFVSDDAEASSWTESNPTRVGETLQDIVWNGVAPPQDGEDDPLVDALVTVGNNGTVLTSTDGLNWNNRSQASKTTNALGAIVWGRGQYVATGTSGTVITSPDGRLWTERVSGTDTSFFGLTFWPQRQLFAAVGASGGLLTSPDALGLWKRVRSGTDRQLNSVLPLVTETDTYLVTVGSGGTILTHQREP